MAKELTALGVKGILITAAVGVLSRKLVVPGSSNRSPNTAIGIRPTSISHAESEMGAKEPPTTQSLRTGSATESTIR